MKKKILTLLCIFLIGIFLTGCGKEEKATPSIEENSVVGASEQSSNREQQSEALKVTDQKVVDSLVQFVDTLAGLPAFGDITSIDKVWIVRKYHTEVGFYDSALYKKYNNDMFSKLSDIEEIAKKKINPNISMSKSDDFSTCDGKTRDNPLWIEKEQVFGWFPSGGYTYLDRTYFLEATERDGKFVVKAIDLYLSFDSDYFDETSPQGTLYALMAEENSTELTEVGTFTLNHDTNEASYNFTKEPSALRQYEYIVETNSSAGFQLAAKQAVTGTNQSDASKSDIETEDTKSTQKIPSSEAAIKLLQELPVYKDNPDIGYTDFGEVVYKGVPCYYIRTFSKEMRANGGSGTLELLHVETDTGRIWLGDTEVTNGQ